jgi:hypothetical protein
MPDEPGLTGYVGPAGRAYKVTRHQQTDERARSLQAGAFWFLHLPEAHPVWPRYVLSCVHLQHVDGLPDPFLSSPEMTHELMLLALDPEAKPTPSDTSTWSPLTPPNFAFQFKVESNEQAALLTELMARSLVDRRLPAELDDYLGGMAAWERSVRMTAEHVVAAAHGANPHVEPAETPAAATPADQ